MTLSDVPQLTNMVIVSSMQLFNVAEKLLIFHSWSLVLLPMPEVHNLQFGLVIVLVGSFSGADSHQRIFLWFC